MSNLTRAARTPAHLTSSQELEMLTASRYSGIPKESGVFRILIDTCVWLDLAKDQQQHALLGVLETLISRRDVELILPRLVVDEFARNKARVAKEAVQSLSSALRRVQDAVWRLEPPRRRAGLSVRLHDLDSKLPALGESAVAGIGRVEALFKQPPSRGQCGRLSWSARSRYSLRRSATDRRR